MRFLSDVVIIGAGITGCSAARALSRYGCSVTVIDRACDVAEGATKANSGIVHAGFDAMPGTAKAYYNVSGAAMFPGLCSALSVPYKRCGALVIGFSDRDRQTLSELLRRGEANGVRELRIIDRDELLRLEPEINPEVVCALLVPSSAIVSPYELAFALADDAALNGVSFRFNEQVGPVKRLDDGTFSVLTQNNEYSCRALITCAGSFAADIHNQLSTDKISIINRRGQYYLLDHSVSSPFSHTVFQCPSPLGKGVLVTLTVHGNVLIGPNAEDIADPLDTSTTQEGLDYVLEKAKRTWPKLSVRQNITNFSGVRAHPLSDDFIVGPVQGCPGAFEASGIESPGLSSAPAIGEDLAAMAAEYIGASKKTEIVPYVSPGIPFRDLSPAGQEAAVRENPAQGRIICRCEVVTEAEIRQAVNRPVGATTIDGVKRRTRAGMGRCQGGFCLPRVAAIISEETGIPVDQVTKGGGNSYLLSGTVESFLKGGICDE